MQPEIPPSPVLITRPDQMAGKKYSEIMYERGEVEMFKAMRQSGAEMRGGVASVHEGGEFSRTSDEFAGTNSRALSVAPGTARSGVNDWHRAANESWPTAVWRERISRSTRRSGCENIVCSRTTATMQSSSALNLRRKCRWGERGRRKASDADFA